MMALRCFVAILEFLIPVLVFGAAVTVSAETSPDSLLPRYVDALLRKDRTAAEECWLPSEVARSHQLGIVFEGVDAKFDCASPLHDALDGVRAGAVQIEFLPPEGNGDFRRAGLLLRAGKDSLHTTYHLIQKEGAWHLCSPLAVWASAWKSRETSYGRVVYSDSSFLNSYALADLDRFIENTATVLGGTGEELAGVSEGRIDYYLCNEEETGRLTGYPVHGMTSLPLDAIVTRHLPHYHELVHLLVNLALSPLPLHTVPILQEGLAVSIGGRWEKAPDVLLQLGAVMIEEDFGALEDVLTYRAFHSPSADLDANYAVSGLFVEFLRAEYGLPRVLTAYRRLSGTNAEVQSWDATHVQQVLAEAVGTSWASIEASFHEFAARNRLGRLRPGMAEPDGGPVFSLLADSVTFSIWETDSTYQFTARVASPRCGAAVLLKPSSAESDAGYVSRLFLKHFPTRAYGGERYSIAFNSAESGLYNYWTDNLLEKLVIGIHPSEGYWEYGSHTIRFELMKTALDRPLSEYQLDMIEP